MENNYWDPAENADPQNDWRNAETNNTESKDISDADAPRYEEKSFDDRANFAASITSEEINGVNEPIPNRTDEPIDSPIYAASGTPDPDDEDDEEEDEEDEEGDEEDEEGDWGHVDPAEGNSPFPDSNDPSGPGSAV